MGYGDPIEDPIELAHRFIKELDKGAVLRVSQALLAANERAERYEKALRHMEWHAIRIMRTESTLPIFPPPDDACHYCQGVKPPAFGWPEENIGHRADCVVGAALAPREGGT